MESDGWPLTENVRDTKGSGSERGGRVCERTPGWVGVTPLPRIWGDLPGCAILHQLHLSAPPPELNTMAKQGEAESKCGAHSWCTKATQGPQS